MGGGVVPMGRYSIGRLPHLTGGLLVSTTPFRLARLLLRAGVGRRLGWSRRRGGGRRHRVWRQEGGGAGGPTDPSRQGALPLLVTSQHSRSGTLWTGLLLPAADWSQRCVQGAEVFRWAVGRGGHGLYSGLVPSIWRR